MKNAIRKIIFEILIILVLIVVYACGKKNETLSSETDTTTEMVIENDDAEEEYDDEFDTGYEEEQEEKQEELVEDEIDIYDRYVRVDYFYEDDETISYEEVIESFILKSKPTLNGPSLEAEKDKIYDENSLCNAVVFNDYLFVAHIKDVQNDEGKSKLISNVKIFNNNLELFKAYDDYRDICHTKLCDKEYICLIHNNECINVLNDDNDLIFDMPIYDIKMSDENESIYKISNFYKTFLFDFKDLKQIEILSGKEVKDTELNDINVSVKKSFSLNDGSLRLVETKGKTAIVDENSSFVVAPTDKEVDFANEKFDEKIEAIFYVREASEDKNKKGKKVYFNIEGRIVPPLEAYVDKDIKPLDYGYYTYRPLEMNNIFRTVMIFSVKNKKENVARIIDSKYSIGVNNAKIYRYNNKDYAWLNVKKINGNIYYNLYDFDNNLIVDMESYCSRSLLEEKLGEEEKLEKEPTKYVSSLPLKVEDVISADIKVVRPDYSTEHISINKVEDKNNLFANHSDYKIGDTYTFGHSVKYILGGSTFNLEWIILDIKGSNMLLMSKYILDYVPFSDVMDANWETSNIRNGLKTSWHDNAFYDNDIYYSHIDFGKEIVEKEIHSKDGNKDIVTKDYMFLPSKDDIVKYLGDVTNENKNAATNGNELIYGMKANQQDIIVCDDESKWYNGNTPYFLRDTNNGKVLYIDVDGKINEEGIEPTESLGIRPFMWVDKPEILKGETMMFGKYEQDNDFTNGKEDIEWLVLSSDGEKALLMSKDAIDAEYRDIGFNSFKWDECTLRDYINVVLYNNAFSDAEKNKIIPVENTCIDGWPKTVSDKSNVFIKTIEKVFLPSHEMYRKYGKYEDKNKGNTFTACPSEYVKSFYKARSKIYSGKNGYTQYFGMDSRNKMSEATVFSMSGEPQETSMENRDYQYHAIRPCIWIDLTGKYNDKKFEYKPNTNCENIETKIDQNIEFGRYEIDGDMSKNEPLVWYVLDDNFEGKYKLLTTQCVIDMSKYANTHGEKYENSVIRKFINDDFYNKAFNDIEKGKIIKYNGDFVNLWDSELAKKYKGNKNRFENLITWTDGYAAKRYEELTGKSFSNTVYYLKDVDSANGKVRICDLQGYSNSVSGVEVHGVRPIIVIEK